jgi:uncharacterized damage-inducible protein DinB
VRRLRQYQARIETCLDRLTEDQIWMREAETQNAIGNLVLHLCGNVTQWILSGVGGRPDTRDRDAEFEARGDAGTEELRTKLRMTVESAAAVIEALSEERLSERVQVQNYDVTILEAVYHVLTHFAEHTGQIIFATKLFTREDLGFYVHLKRAHGEKTP